jgi:hypothetical protein
VVESKLKDVFLEKATEFVWSGAIVYDKDSNGFFVCVCVCVCYRNHIFLLFRPLYLNIESKSLTWFVFIRYAVHDNFYEFTTLIILY